MGHIYSTIMFGNGIDYSHAVTERNILGRNIRISYNGIQRIKMQCIKSILPTKRCGFNSITFMPIFISQQVSDFGNLRRLVFLHGNAALSYHFIGIL